MSQNRATALLTPPAGNDGADLIRMNHPYMVTVSIQGTASLLFHRWPTEGVAVKAAADKGGAQKKLDNLDAYVYRTPDGQIGLPGEYLRQAVIGAARFRRPLRFPHQSTQELYKTGVLCLTDLAPLGKSTWDYEDRRRAMVRGHVVTRVRPAFLAGWAADFQLMVTEPKYISPSELKETIQVAGQLIGVGDFRPAFGRFLVTRFDVLSTN